MANSATKIMENQQKIIKAEELLAKSWRDYVQNFKKFMIIYLHGLLGFLPLLVIMLLVSIFGNLEMWQAIPLGLQISLGIILTFAFIFSVLLAIYYSVRLKAASFLLVKNNYSSPVENFKESKKYFWGFLGVSLLLFVIILAWGFVFLVPALIFGVYYSFASYVLVMEDKRAFSSMERSYDLVKGYWWPVFGRMALLMVGALIISLIVSTPLNFMEQGSWMFVTYNILTNIMWAIISPYFVIYSFHIYNSLKEVNK